MSDRQAPPYQPKWILQFQVFLLRHRLMGPMNRQFMVITTTGRKSGRRHSVPIRLPVAVRSNHAARAFPSSGEVYVSLGTQERRNWLAIAARGVE